MIWQGTALPMGIPVMAIMRLAWSEIESSCNSFIVFPLKWTHSHDAHSLPSLLGPMGNQAAGVKLWVMLDLGPQQS